MPNIKKTLLRTLPMCVLLSSAACYAQNFVVQKIQVEGLQHISRSTFFSYLPIRAGQRINDDQSAEIIRSLYQTGFFSNVTLSQSNSNLIIRVTERPVISSVKLYGIKAIPKKQLQDALQKIRLTAGQILDRFAINELQQTLIQEYYNLGHYAAKVNIEVINQPENRAAVNIKVYEGPVTKIKEIKIIGNTNFKEKELLKNFELKPAKWWRFLGHSDQYSKEKLNADLERLRSFYMNRGYLECKIDTAQVSITPDKKYIYIVVHVTSGPMYHIKGYALSGNLAGHGDELRKFITIKAGDVFSRQQIIDTTSAMHYVLGNYGYAQPNIQANPTIDKNNHLVFINFIIDPGKRIYVRRITFTGNEKTNETVLRRELRQSEDSLYSISKIDESKRRIANLGYIKNIDLQATPVPGNPDQVDLNYNVTEESSMVANFRGGYSDADGFIYGASLNESNFMGSGKGVGIQFDNSSYYHTYSLNYFNPYHTINGVSLNVSLYMQRVLPDKVDMSAYTNNSRGGSVMYGYPTSEYSRINLGYGYENIHIQTEGGTPIEIYKFLDKYGKYFDEIKLLGGWNYNKLDRAIFPTKGLAQYLNLEVGAPAANNSVNYYTANYNAKFYYPLYKDFIFNARAEFGYGNGFGYNNGELPFFKNYTAGGMGTVRGFEPYSLGPKENKGWGPDTLGGNLLTAASVGIIIPNPLNDSIRTTAFVDVGNVYKNSFEFDELRSGAGLQIDWRSPMGVISCSFAEPIIKKKGDRSKFFDFSIGTSF